MIEYTGDERSMYLHRSDGAKFLTAKAGDAMRAVDRGNTVFHRDNVRRADLGAFFTANAKLFRRARLGTKCRANKGSREFSMPFKLQTAAHVNVLKIINCKSVKIAYHGQCRSAFGNQSQLVSDLQSRNVFDI